MSMTKIKLFNVTFVNMQFILNVTTLSIQITDIFKPVMNHGTAQNVAARFFLLISYVIKTSQLVVQILIAVLCHGKDKKTAEISSLLLKPTINLELLLNQFNNATPKMMTLKILFLLNMILMKCTMLEYITKINLCPCFICSCSKCMFLW